MRRLFLDTGYVIALESSQDQFHRTASAHWAAISRQEFQLVTKSWILDEVATFFNNRGFHEKAVELGRRFQDSRSVDLIHIEESLFRHGWHLFETYQDKRFSLTDCVSFALMKALGLSEALAFDHHFEQAGFVRLPVADGSTA